MKALGIVLVFMHVLYAQNVDKKMVISTHIKTKDAAKSLYTLEKFFHDNRQAHALKQKYHLQLSMELLEQYVLITIKPIKHITVKNRLHALLYDKFPQSFVVDNSKRILIKPEINTLELAKNDISKMPTKKVIKKQKIEHTNPQTKRESIQKYSSIKKFWNELDSEWLGLIFLALAGFLLVFRSARQMTKIKSLQDEVSQYQRKIEGEIKSMGEQNA